MAGTDEPPEHRACRTPTTPERRGTEAAAGRWRLGESNWRNLYIGNEHVAVTWASPHLAAQVVAAMNHTQDRDDLAAMVAVIADRLETSADPDATAHGTDLRRILNGTYDPRES